MAISLTSSTSLCYRTIISDIIALTIVGIVPAASHLLKIPIYFIEPMRIMLIFSLLYSARWNAYALAVALPLFSFLVSGHPESIKMMIIMAELTINTWIFVQLYMHTKKAFLSTFSSIVLSKIFCYAMYFALFSLEFVKAEAETTFLLAQAGLSLLLSSVVWIILYMRNRVIQTVHE